MYLTSGQPNIMGPGTGLVQRYNWTPDQEKQLRTAFGKGMGCGCSGLGCKCNGLGLFDSGMDFSGWGFPEFAIVGIGAYMVLSTLSTTKRVARRVSSAASGAYRGARRSNPGRRKARR